MGAIIDHARVVAAGIVPIAFEPGDAKCPGAHSTTRNKSFGLCVLCARYRQDAAELEPALRLVNGTAECVNFTRIQ